MQEGVGWGSFAAGTYADDGIISASDRAEHAHCRVKAKFHWIIACKLAYL
jgi:hypothetical protein